MFLWGKNNSTQRPQSFSRKNRKERGHWYIFTLVDFHIILCDFLCALCALCGLKKITTKDTKIFICEAKMERG